MKADVVVLGVEDLEAIYRAGGDSIGKVVAVCDPPFAGSLIAELRGAHGDLVVLRNEARLGRIRCWNRGLFLRRRDVLLLGSGVVPGEGCLEEMLEVLYASDRIASVAPLPGSERAIDPGRTPRLCDVPTAAGPCLLLRHMVLNMIGGFDAAFLRADDAQDDWAMRAQRLGLRHVRANRAAALARNLLHEEPRPAPAPLLISRHPHLLEQATAPAAREPPDRFEVLYQQAPIADARQLLAILEGALPVVLRAAGTWPERALLFFAAHAAQAVVAASDEERTALIAGLSLDAASVQVVGAPTALPSLFRSVADRPDTASLRRRARIAELLRSVAAG